ncbi:cobalamin biosynthesis protein [Halonotius terrestris]|uniref:Cobalamin biosynthesis protein n=1 Tax=Halonotius terrestris TaxID=2487750 RepID=A0A8J8TB12_9EURY|nr:cobalamin biosynthesis protein [Halonotius terrestris]TQQ79241.1 cobalamin biosynthesis protein [Halonotius terrestris]
MSVAVPDDLLAGHPSTAYFWGRVAGNGEIENDRLTVTTNDEAAAETLSEIVGSEIDHNQNTRDYAHNTDITKTEDEYTVEVTSDDLFGMSGALGLPVDGRGNYRFGAFSDYRRDLLRGILEGCGTICFKSSSGTVGVSFVHDDAALLEVVQDLIDDDPVDAPYGDLSDTSSGGYWFGVDDDAAADFGMWLYEETAETGLFAPSRRRKLVQSLDQATDIEFDRSQFEA